MPRLHQPTVQLTPTCLGKFHAVQLSSLHLH